MQIELLGAPITLKAPNGRQKLDALLIDEFHRMELANLTYQKLLVCVDFDKNARKRIKSQEYLNSISVLLRFEPKIVNPRGFRNRFSSIFTTVIDVGRVPDETAFKLNWPQVWEPLEEAETSPREQKVVPMVNANKLSLVRGELYSLRREVLRNISQVKIYGMNWDIGFARKIMIVAFSLLKLWPRLDEFQQGSMKYWLAKTDKWLGPLDDKISGLRGYERTLVIENSKELTTEKLFDALQAGTYPIYVGPDNQDHLDIPDNFYTKADADLDAIKAALRTSEDVNLAEWRRDVAVWLASQRTFDSWGVPNFVAELANQISRFIEHPKTPSGRNGALRD